MPAVPASRPGSSPPSTPWPHRRSWSTPWPTSIRPSCWGRFREGVDGLAAALDGLDADGWETLAEAPPGHIPIRALALHALWDGWVHERDIVLPLGLDPVEDDDEIRGCLLYAAALGPAFVGVRRLGPDGDPGDRGQRARHQRSS